MPPLENDDVQDIDHSLENEDGDTGSSQDRPVSQRERDIEAISAGRLKSMEADGVILESPREPAIPDPEPNSDDQLAAQLGDDDRPVAYLSDMNAMVKVKVDGEEFDLPLAEVVKSYQKDSAATKRLAQATRLLEMAQEKASTQGLANGVQEQDTHESTDDDKNGTGNADKLSAIKGAFSKLIEGDEEGAAEAMLRLVERDATAIPQQTIDPAALAAQVRQQLAVENAYNEVQGDYPELFADTDRGVVLGNAAYQRIQAKTAAGIPRDQAIRESASEVAMMFGVAKTGGRQPTEPRRTVRDEKLARKESLDIPGATNVAASGSQAPNEATNVSDTIRAMAEQRLGQSMRPASRIN